MSVKRNTAYNLGGMLVPALLMIISVPIYLNFVGEERYGLLAIIWLITGYFGFFDFGLGQATAYKIAKLGESESEQAKQALWTALILNLGFGLVGGGIVFLLAPLLFSSLFNTPDVLLTELQPTYAWIAVAIPLTTLEGVFAGALLGRRRFFALNSRAIAAAVLVQFIPLSAVIWLSPTLSIAVPATVLARSISVTIFAGLAFRTIKAGLSPSLGDTKLFFEMLSFGGWVTLGKSLLQLIGNLDRLVIAATMTPLAVTLYSVSYQLIARGGQIPRALASAMFPDFAQSAPEKARFLAFKAMRANLAVMTVLCAALIIGFRTFLTIWLDPGFAAKAALTASLLTLSLWINGVAVVAIMLLEAQGKAKATFLVSAWQAIPYTALVCAGAIFGGIVGVALARNARSLLDACLLCSFAEVLRATAPIVPLPGTLLLSAVLWNAASIDPVLLWTGNAVLFSCSLFMADHLFPEGKFHLKETVKLASRASIDRQGL